MLILACVLLGLLLVPATGGMLRRLGDLRWRSAWLVVAALGVQLVVLEGPGLPTTLAAAGHVATYAMAAAFVWLNRSVRGLVVLAAGALSNGLAIVLNGGTLPSSAAARDLAGLEEAAGFANSGVVERPVLGFLGDNFAIPAGFPLANVFSVGDVLIVVGALWVLFSATRAGRPAGPDRPLVGHAHRGIGQAP
ncbi:MAG: DUF5317 domain-containing protein [Actinomycetales bacterium]|nr:DUF5317 domain-containing protein [Actinomycetales bacterium]